MGWCRGHTLCYGKWRGTPSSLPLDLTKRRWDSSFPYVVTLQQSPYFKTMPPAASTLAFSEGRSGLWSSDNAAATFFVAMTARESPMFTMNTVDPKINAAMQQHPSLAFRIFAIRRNSLSTALQACTIAASTSSFDQQMREGGGIIV